MTLLNSQTMRLDTFRNWWKRRGVDPDADLLKRLHPPGHFRALLDVERMRADRAGGRFTLVTFRFPAQARRDFLLFAQYLIGRVRVTDHAGLMDELCLAAILWNTGAAGGRQFVESLALTGQPWTRPACDVFTYPFADDDHGGDDELTAHTPEDDLLRQVQEIAATATSPVHAAASPSGTSGELSISAAPRRHAARGGATATLPEPRTRLRTPGFTAPLEDLESLRGQSKNATATDVVVQPLEPLFQQPLPRWKRAIDIVGAGGGLLVLAPLLLLIAALIKLTSRGPALFVQRRSGLGGRPFKIYKFRTMCMDAEVRKAALRQFSEQDGPAFKMTHDPRVTSLGRYLRKACIDELPQLWNVLRGDMTLVGPRPLPCNEQAGCDVWHGRRLDVTPGLTCIWQLHGKSKVSFAEWMRMDIRYIKARTFLQDVRLIFETIWAVVLHRGSC